MSFKVLESKKVINHIQTIEIQSEWKLGDEVYEIMYHDPEGEGKKWHLNIKEVTNMVIHLGEDREISVEMYSSDDIECDFKSAVDLELNENDGYIAYFHSKEEARNYVKQRGEDYEF